MTPTVASLCSGYAGLDLAVHDVFGGELAWVADIDPGACKILAHRFPGVPNLGDITVTDWAAARRPDILTAGFPCQDVSCAGARAGLREGNRTGVWAHVARAIAALTPRLVVLENVRGLLSAGADSDLELCPWCVGEAGNEHPLRALGAVLGDLSGLGYDARWSVVSAADAGAPHRRERVFVVAWPAADAASDEPRGHVPVASVDQGQAGDRPWPGDRRAPADTCGGSIQRRRDGRVLAGTQREAASSGDQRERDGHAAADCRPAAEDADRAASGERRQPAPGQAPAGRPRADAGGSGGARVAADPAGVGRDAWRPESAGIVGRPDAALCGDDLAADADGSGWRAAEPEDAAREPDSHRGAPADADRGGREGPEPARAGPEREAAAALGRRSADECGPAAADAIVCGRGAEPRQQRGVRAAECEPGDIAWGQYAAAIARWEHVLGRSAPRPTEPGRTGERLSPAFVEWMQGLPAGWVTAVPGLSRNQQLHALGNGVVPQQCALALRLLLPAWAAREVA